jgi:hypothetical protein
MFLHYTDPVAAANIVATGKLNPSRTITDAVYAVAVGGRNVPTVQHSRSGARDVAVLFDCNTVPDTIFPEECIWHRRDPLVLNDALIVSASDADRLLDGTAAIPDDGIHHLSDCTCDSCTLWRSHW